MLFHFVAHNFDSYIELALYVAPSTMYGVEQGTEDYLQPGKPVSCGVLFLVQLQLTLVARSKTRRTWPITHSSKENSILKQFDESTCRSHAGRREFCA